MPNVVLDVAVALRLWTDAVRCARVRRTGRGDGRRACRARDLRVCIADMGDLSHHYRTSRLASQLARSLVGYTVSEDFYCYG